MTEITCDLLSERRENTVEAPSELLAPESILRFVLRFARLRLYKISASLNIIFVFVYYFDKIIIIN